MGIERLCRAFRWGLVALSLWLRACGGAAEPMPYVDFNRRAPLATPRRTGVVPLRVGIAAVLSP